MCGCIRTYVGKGAYIRSMGDQLEGLIEKVKVLIGAYIGMGVQLEGLMEKVKVCIIAYIGMGDQLEGLVEALDTLP